MSSKTKNEPKIITNLFICVDKCEPPPSYDFLYNKKSYYVTSCMEGSCSFVKKAFSKSKVSKINRLKIILKILNFLIIFF